jgi:hypothetical protein
MNESAGSSAQGYSLSLFSTEAVEKWRREEPALSFTRAPAPQLQDTLSLSLSSTEAVEK